MRNVVQVNIVAFKKGQLKVLSHGFDRCLGGRDLDLAMMKFFAAEFEAKHKVNVLEKPRSRLRLRVAVEKVTSQLWIKTRSEQLPNQPRS